MNLIKAFSLLIIAVFSGVLLQQLPDMVMLSCHNWSIELPLWLLIISLGLTFSTIWLAVRLYQELLAGYDHGKSYWRLTKKKTALQRTTQALLQLAASEWSLAERNAIKGAEYYDLPFINYVSAAKAAQEQQAWDRRDKYLVLATKALPGSEVAIGIVTAKLQYNQGDLGQSLQTLKKLQQMAPKNPAVWQLLSVIYESNQDWPNLLQVLPALKKYHSCPKERIWLLHSKAYCGLLQEKSPQFNKQSLLQFWQEIPKAIRQEGMVVAAYVKCLQQLGMAAEALTLLRRVLTKTWDHSLVKLYASITGDNLDRQIYYAEEWLKAHPGDPVLLFTLARLCMQHKLWGKARDYLEMSIQLQPTPAAYAALGQLLGDLGETKKCQECYRQGLLTMAHDIHA